MHLQISLFSFVFELMKSYHITKLTIKYINFYNGTVDTSNDPFIATEICNFKSNGRHYEHNCFLVDHYVY